MFYLLAAIATSTGILIAFKLFERWKIDIITAITFNYLMASFLGFRLCPGETEIFSAPSQPWFAVSVASGFMLMFTFMVYAISAQRAGIAITSVSGKMSVIIPVILGFVYFGEKTGWLKITGIVLAVAAFWLIFKKEGKFTFNKKFLFLPLLLLAGNGINDSLLKIAEGIYLKNDFIFFLSTAFFISLILGILVLTYNCLKNRKFPALKSMIAGLILGLLNWYSTYFFLLSLRYFEVSVLVPVFNASIVTIGALAGYFIFRENLKRINWVGIFLAICAIILMTV